MNKIAPLTKRRNALHTQYPKGIYAKTKVQMPNAQAVLILVSKIKHSLISEPCEVNDEPRLRDLAIDGSRLTPNGKMMGVSMYKI